MSGEETEVSLNETGTGGVLVGKFSTITGTDTQGARLRGSDGGKSEHADENSDQLFHEQLVIWG